MKKLFYLLLLPCCLLLGCEAPTSSLADDTAILTAKASGSDYLTGTRFGKRIPSREGFGAGFPVSQNGFHNRFAEVVRVRTEQFADVAVAEAAGYVDSESCGGTSNGDYGRQFIKEGLIDAEINPFEPEILLYLPASSAPDSDLRLVGVGYRVSREAWEAVPGNEHRRPHLAGMPFGMSLFAFGTDYGLHLWVHQENPLGLFARGNPTVSCPE